MKRSGLLLSLLFSAVLAVSSALLVSFTAQGYQACSEDAPVEEQNDLEIQKQREQEERERQDQERREKEDEKNSDDNSSNGDNGFNRSARPTPTSSFSTFNAGTALSRTIAAVQHSESAAEKCEKETSWGAVGIAGMLTLIAGLTATYLMHAARSNRESIAPATGTTKLATPPSGAAASPTGTHSVASTTGSYPVVTPPPAPTSQRETETTQQRLSLINTLIYVRDRATSPAIAEKVLSDLEQVGVHEISPLGEIFDRQHHEAGGHTAPENPSQNGRIAAVEVPGYKDGSRVLRTPIVTVYRSENQ